MILFLTPEKLNLQVFGIVGEKVQVHGRGLLNFVTSSISVNPAKIYQRANF
jgi:2,3-bisphosphoglycerate-independent phosphoglycerate mutase